MALNNLGILYKDTQRFQQTEEVYQEALRIYRQLAEVNPSVHLLYVATVLNNLAVFYRDTHRRGEAMKMYQEAQSTHEKIAIGTTC
jgi:tetratricopeptide (TPR) repeat protein